MPRLALLILTACLGCGTYWFGRDALGDETAGRAPPAAAAQFPLYSARSVSVRQGRLVMVDLESLDKDLAPKQLAGRVLISCDRRTGLLFFASLVGSKMARATPFLGQEGPGKPLTDVGEAKATRQGIGASWIPLKEPVSVTLEFLDGKGIPCRTQVVAIKELQVTTAAGGK